ncbi:MAG: multidrug efflux RND transporter permease subunit [Desulfomonilaceae bacterium]
MRLPHFFVDRPIFAGVLSIVIMLVGIIAYFRLPVSRYPPIAPPTIVVSTSYPGATPDVVAQTVATPLEEQINGVEDMLYMESNSAADGEMSLTITFKLGTDIDKAQVLVQNRVAIAEPQLPQEVRQLGVTTQKQSPDFLLAVNLISPNHTFSQLYLSNYAYLEVQDILSRIEGVGNLSLFGAREYSMRIWLDAGRLAELNLTAGDVVQALQQQNVQVAAGIIGQPPVRHPGAFQLTVNAKGRLRTPKEFADIVVKTGPSGSLVRVRDVARVELGALDYSENSYLNGQESVTLALFLLPGANAVATSHRVLATMKELSKRFPEGLEYRVVYNPTVFVEQSIQEVYVTLLIASALVTLVIFVFLQSWRATLIPLMAIPVSLIGTFAVMFVLGFSLNNLSLFGLVLAIGIVVDDAIVVVENAQRNIDAGLPPRKATHVSMDEVASALISAALVLSAVFIPTAFLGGISGQFYRQFALTIAVSTVISAFVSLTLSPAMSALLLRPKGAPKGALANLSERLFGWFFRGFSSGFNRARDFYSTAVSRTIRVTWIAILVYVALLGLTYWGFRQVPSGFIPLQDQGYLIVSIQLPEGASLYRTDAVTRRVLDIAGHTPGIADTVAFTGFNIASRSSGSADAGMFTPLENASERASKGLTAERIMADLRRQFSKIQEANVMVIPPPPVPGIGFVGGFKMQVEDRSGQGFLALHNAATDLVAAASREPGLVQVYSTFRVSAPQLYVHIDRTKASMLNVPLGNVFQALQVYLGSLYVNDFNLFGRTFRVMAQGESRYRSRASDIPQLKTRSNTGAIVPLGSLVHVVNTTGPDRVVRYNLYPAADVNGSTRPGFGSGQSLATMERLAKKILPAGMAFEWTDLAYQEKLAGNVALYIFPLCVLFVFLMLSAQYESWVLPLAVILIVPMCLLCAIAGVWFRGMENNVLTQIGFVVLVGLACKNAILIVQFAKAEQDKGKDKFEATVSACRLRLRPILMTSFAFILGVVPLVIATGAGYEMRRAVGTAVFSGMLGVSFFGLFLTPVFYVVLSRFVKHGPTDDASR